MALWVAFKTFVTPVSPCMFAALQLPVLTKYAPEPDIRPRQAASPHLAEPSR